MLNIISQAHKDQQRKLLFARYLQLHSLLVLALLCFALSACRGKQLEQNKVTEFATNSQTQQIKNKSFMSGLKLAFLGLISPFVVESFKYGINATSSVTEIMDQIQRFIK